MENNKPKIESFEDLMIWKESFNAALKVYIALKDCRDFGLRDQLRRAAVSVPSNIAEGFERQTNKEFIYYLYISKGSSGEVRTQLLLAIAVGYIEIELGNELVNDYKRISAMIGRLIQTRKEKF